MRNKTIPAGKIGLGASLALLSGGAAQAAKPARQNPKRPNIVLVIADDCRHYDLGCYGSPDAITPNGWPHRACVSSASSRRRP